MHIPGSSTFPLSASAHHFFMLSKLFISPGSNCRRWVSIRGFRQLLPILMLEFCAVFKKRHFQNAKDKERGEAIIYKHNKRVLIWLIFFHATSENNSQQCALFCSSVELHIALAAAQLLIWLLSGTLKHDIFNLQIFLFPSAIESVCQLDSMEPQPFYVIWNTTRRAGCFSFWRSTYTAVVLQTSKGEHQY